MPIYTRIELIERLSKQNPDERIWIMEINKDDIISDLVDMEITDEQDNLYEKDRISEIVDDDFAQELFNSLDSDDDLWERFSDTITECEQSAFNERLPDVELEQENELWDK